MSKQRIRTKQRRPVWVSLPFIIILFVEIIRSYFLREVFDFPGSLLLLLFLTAVSVLLFSLILRTEDLTLADNCLDALDFSIL